MSDPQVDRMSLIEHCPECEAAWERGHKAGRAFQVAQGTDNWKAMHAALTVENERLDNQLQGAVDTLAEVRLYAEKMLRSGDGNTRIHGADLLGVIDHDAGGQ